jgi:S-formylglutathione hydrolase FrmB
VLVDGNDFWIKGGGGNELIKGVITRAQASPHALPGKVGVVGLSLGGATALTYAARMPDQVATVVAMYPLTNCPVAGVPGGSVRRAAVPPCNGRATGCR